MSNYHTFLECPNFYQKMAHMEQLSRVGSVVESKFSRVNKRSDSHAANFIRNGGLNAFGIPQANKDVRFRHSNMDCRRSLTPQESLKSRARFAAKVCAVMMGNNDRNLGGSDY